jgi:hypothetical protein
MAQKTIGRGAAATLALLVCAPAGEAAADVAVDLELVLAVDVSGSMDTDEQQLQREGYVAALAHPDVVGAIRSGGYQRIAVTYVEWAGPDAQSVTIPWRLLEDRASAEAFAGELAAAPFARIRRTSISGALDFSARLFDGNGYDGFRRVIDVSGDGPNNSGPPVAPVREAVLARGIVINGLPITLKRGDRGFGSIPDLDVYYEDCVIGGPGSFMIAIDAPDQFVDAIRRKLVLEIAGGEPRLVPASEAVRPPRIDCMIGERLRRTWEWER